MYFSPVNNSPTSSLCIASILAMCVLFIFFIFLFKHKKNSLVTGVGSIKKNQHDGGGGGPLDKIEAAIESVGSELLSVVGRINDLEQKESLAAKEEALLEHLRKKEEQLRAEKLILLERGQHSGSVQICGC
jgi:hypothetical protein